VQDNYFGEEVAAGYDESSGPRFDHEVIARTVDVLAELAGDGARSSSRSGPPGWHCRSRLGE